MNLKRRTQVILNLALAFILLCGTLPIPQPAEAGLNPFNAVMGLIRVVNGINRRNRIYRAARDTKKDFDAYYGSLRDTAHLQLLEGDLSSLQQGADGPERTRAAAYIRMAAAMQAEQAAVQRAIDAETNAARREFNRNLANQLQSIILQLPGAQRILGQVRSTIANIRSAAAAVQAAAAAGQPLDRLAEDLAQQVHYSAELQQLVRNLGSTAGSELDRKLGGALNQVDQALGDIRNQANQTVQLLDSMDAEVGQWDLSQAELGPGEELGPANVLLTDRANAVLDVASQALAFLTAAQGTGGTTRQELYAQIRAELLNRRNANLLNAALHTNSVVCAQVDQKAYLAAASALGEAPRTPSDPATASYYVCTDKETGEPVGAWVGQVSGTEGTPEAAPTPERAGSPTPEEDEERWTIADLDAADYLSTSVEITQSYSNAYEQACYADYKLMNIHPTDTVQVLCEQDSYLPGSGQSTRFASPGLLSPGETGSLDIAWHFALGELKQDSHPNRCVAWRISDAEGQPLPWSQWFSQHYTDDASKFGTGLTVIMPPNPCAP